MVGAATSSHPAAVAAVGLLVVGLVASLFLKPSSSREPSETEPVCGNVQLQERLRQVLPPKELLTQEMLQLDAENVLMAP